MPGQEGGLPRLEPQDCRRQAEDFLGYGHQVHVDVPRAIAFGLLAVAGELHEIRAMLRRRR